jgi:hypothetical protein
MLDLGQRDVVVNGVGDLGCDTPMPPKPLDLIVHSSEVLDESDHYYYFFQSFNFILEAFKYF